MSQDQFTIEFRPTGKTLTLKKGQKETLLDLALENGIEIDHACGGVCACSTCHVFVKTGLQTLNPATEDEEDQLDEAPGVGPLSRLACQCIPSGKENLVIEIPNWNRNLVREGR